MDKFCIFCGDKPESKNREHVIPQWLLKITGDPNRNVNLGLKWTTDDLETRQFSFRSFTLPACEACNTEFSDLEAKAKIIVDNILARNALGAAHWDTFFDWLDKVRTGLWLGMIYLNKNHLGLTPHFHINQRMGSMDRVLIIYQTEDDGGTGVCWSPTESPLFQLMPSCFVLTINNFLFFNASYEFLFSQRLGFPFPRTRKWGADGKQLIAMTKGTGKVRFPLIEMKFKAGGTQLFQPMIPYGLFRREDGTAVNCSEYYDNNYVRTNCMNYAAGRGVIFRRHRSDLAVYSTEPSTEWIPKQKFPRKEICLQTVVLAAAFLKEMYSRHPSFDDLSDEQRRDMEAEMNNALSLHKAMIDNHIAQSKKRS